MKTYHEILNTYENEDENENEKNECITTKGDLGRNYDMNKIRYGHQRSQHQPLHQHHQPKSHQSQPQPQIQPQIQPQPYSSPLSQYTIDIYQKTWYLISFHRQIFLNEIQWIAMRTIHSIYSQKPPQTIQMMTRYSPLTVLIRANPDIPNHNQQLIQPFNQPTTVFFSYYNQVISSLLPRRLQLYTEQILQMYHICRISIRMKEFYFIPNSTGLSGAVSSFPLHCSQANTDQGNYRVFEMNSSICQGLYELSQIHSLQEDLALGFTRILVLCGEIVQPMSELSADIIKLYTDIYHNHATMEKIANFTHHCRELPYIFDNLRSIFTYQTGQKGQKGQKSHEYSENDTPLAFISTPVPAIARNSSASQVSCQFCRFCQICQCGQFPQNMSCTHIFKLHTSKAEYLLQIEEFMTKMNTFMQVFQETLAMVDELFDLDSNSNFDSDSDSNSDSNAGNSRNRCKKYDHDDNALHELSKQWKYQANATISSLQWIFSCIKIYILYAFNINSFIIDYISEYSVYKRNLENSQRNLESNNQKMTTSMQKQQPKSFHFKNRRRCLLEYPINLTDISLQCSLLLLQKPIKYVCIDPTQTDQEVKAMKESHISEFAHKDKEHTNQIYQIYQISQIYQLPPHAIPKRTDYKYCQTTMPLPTQKSQKSQKLRYHVQKPIYIYESTLHYLSKYATEALLMLYMKYEGGMFGLNEGDKAFRLYHSAVYPDYQLNIQKRDKGNTTGINKNRNKTISKNNIPHLTSSPKQDNVSNAYHAFLKSKIHTLYLTNRNYYKKLQHLQPQQTQQTRCSFDDETPTSLQTSIWNHWKYQAENTHHPMNDITIITSLFYKLSRFEIQSSNLGGNPIYPIYGDYPQQKSQKSLKQPGNIDGFKTPINAPLPTQCLDNITLSSTLRSWYTKSCYWIRNSIIWYDYQIPTMDNIRTYLNMPNSAHEKSIDVAENTKNSTPTNENEDENEDRNEDENKDKNKTVKDDTTYIMNSEDANHNSANRHEIHQGTDILKNISDKTTTQSMIHSPKDSRISSKSNHITEMKRLFTNRDETTLAEIRKKEREWERIRGQKFRQEAQAVILQKKQQQYIRQQPQQQQQLEGIADSRCNSIHSTNRDKSNHDKHTFKDSDRGKDEEIEKQTGKQTEKETEEETEEETEKQKEKQCQMHPRGNQEIQITYDKEELSKPTLQTFDKQLPLQTDERVHISHNPDELENHIVSLNKDNQQTKKFEFGFNLTQYQDYSDGVIQQQLKECFTREKRIEEGLFHERLLQEELHEKNQKRQSINSEEDDERNKISEEYQYLVRQRYSGRSARYDGFSNQKRLKEKGWREKKGKNESLEDREIRRELKRQRQLQREEKKFEQQNKQDKKSKKSDKDREKEKKKEEEEDEIKTSINIKQENIKLEYDNTLLKNSSTSQKLPRKIGFNPTCIIDASILHTSDNKENIKFNTPNINLYKQKKQEKQKPLNLMQQSCTKNGKRRKEHVKVKVEDSIKLELPQDQFEVHNPPPIHSDNDDNTTNQIILKVRAKIHRKILDKIARKRKDMDKSDQGLNTDNYYDESKIQSLISKELQKYIQKHPKASTIGSSENHTNVIDAKCKPDINQYMKQNKQIKEEFKYSQPLFPSTLQPDLYEKNDIPDTNILTRYNRPTSYTN